jgi:hypothetical protein
VISNFRLPSPALSELYSHLLYCARRSQRALEAISRLLERGGKRRQRRDYVARKGDRQLGSRIKRSDQPRALHNPFADNPPHGARRFVSTHPAERPQWARAATMAAWAAAAVAPGAIAQVIVAIVK